jgi:Spy/CpxP family protein refolding chaperone
LHKHLHPHKNNNKTMKTKTSIALLAAIGALALAANAQDNNPNAGGPPTGDGERPAHHQGGPGGQGGMHLLPPRAAETLKLTDEQKTQITALETETKAKLEKILTPEQMQQLKNMRPPMRPGGAGQLRGGPGGHDVGNGAPSDPPQGDN